MKLLIYTHAFAPMIGGIETYTMDLARGIAESAGQGGAVPEVVVVTQSAARGMDDSYLPFRVVRQPSFFRLLRLVHEADVLHMANPPFLPMLFAWLLRRPGAVEHDGYQCACPNGLLLNGLTKSACPGHFMAGRYRKCLRCNVGDLGYVGSFRLLALTFPRRWLCRRMRLHIGPTEHVARRVEMPRPVIIHHGIACRPEGRLTSLAAPLCFAFVGRLVREKGVPVLLHAADELRRGGLEFRLKLIGDGPVRRELELLTDQLQLRDRVQFTGFLQGADLQEALGGVVAAIMPSIWEEPAPLASIEHMTAGRLLIAADIGGLGEIVDGAGLKFAAEDAHALAECMREVIARPNLARELGERARQRMCDGFTLPAMIQNHLRAYSGIVKGNEALP